MVKLPLLSGQQFHGPEFFLPPEEELQLRPRPGKAHLPEREVTDRAVIDRCDVDGQRTAPVPQFDLAAHLVFAAEGDDRTGFDRSGESVARSVAAEALRQCGELAERGASGPAGPQTRTAFQLQRERVFARRLDPGGKFRPRNDSFLKRHGNRSVSR